MDPDKLLNSVIGLFIITLPVLAFYALKVPFLLTLRNALLACHPDNRRIAPNQVWLELIPVFGYFWHFRVIHAIADSLRDEYADRDLSPEFRFGLSSGWRAQIFLPLLAIPAVNVVAGIGLAICFVMYWLTIHVHASTLRAHAERRAECRRVLKAALCG